MALHTGDFVTHWTHPDEVGEIIEMEPDSSGTVFHVLWPGHEMTIPYHSTGTLKKDQRND